ncbi:MAG: hypothetical protein NTV30_04350, partial [Chloroflexi bacterium]|nr:hypothetical protein [Chloroflexota bacterium]
MQVNLNQIQTNILYFYSPADISANELHQRLLKKGIKVGHAGANRYRACTHWMVTEADIDFIIDSIRTIVADLRVQNKKGLT